MDSEGKQGRIVTEKNLDKDGKPILVTFVTGTGKDNPGEVLEVKPLIEKSDKKKKAK